ncbi:hypothetical protein JCM10908_000157 [Rhodotorula pacifica]|uniref:uncharacterized protein n=1 Tax=Rhodotorula pacifica TaxID=1495444 RepID=UPI0031732330
MSTFHVRQPSHGANVDDTPTRPSSAAASFSSNLTSLKPPRTTTLGGMRGAGAGGGLSAVDLNRLDAARHTRTRSLKASDLDGLLDGAGAGAAGLQTGSIDADNTELARRRAEASFQREMEDLRNAAISPSSASDVSLGHHSRHHNHSRESEERQRRNRFGDEDTESAASSSATSANSYESFRIGLSAPSTRARPGVTIRDEEEDDDDDMTYVTLPRTDMSAGLSPAKTATPARPSTAAAASTNLFASPRPFVTSVGASLRAPAPAPISSSSPRPPQARNDENQPPSSSSASAYANRPSPFGKAFAAGPPPLPSQQQQQQALRSSPFSTNANAVAANPPLSTFRTAAPPPAAANAPHSALPHRPSPLGRNSPILAAASSPSASVTTSTPRSYTAPRNGTNAGMAGDRTTMTALPDRTGITEFLRSPERERQILGRMGISSNSERRRDASAAGQGEAMGASASAKTAESNLAAQALASLTTKLAVLERDNARSAARVAELEARLAATATNKGGEADAEARRVRREVEILLGDERARREDLERVVASLRAQNAHLDATLSAQKQTLDALRVSRTASAAPPPTTSQQQPYALRSEVQDLKHALAALGYEVDGVRTVVEELLREKEERDAGRKWEAEEAERRADLEAQARRPFADEASIRVAPHEQEHEESVRSWVGQEEVEMLKREQREEEERRRRGAATMAKPSAAHPSHVHQHDFSIATSQDPTYVPSVGTASEQMSEASFVSVTSATTDSLSSAASSVDEPDFARAERIFASAPTTTRRRTSPRHSQQRRSSAEHASSSHKRRVDRVVLLEEPSANLCSNCHGRKETLKRGSGGGGKDARTRTRTGGVRDDGAEADEEDLAPIDEARERRKREHKAEKVRKEQERQERVEREARKERERKMRKEREEHRRTLEDVLDRLEEEFSVQKKIYLELTTEYQAMSSRAQTAKRRALATHLKKSIDVLEDKARDVKRYADALEDMYEAVHDKTCPQRNLHATV